MLTGGSVGAGWDQLEMAGPIPSEGGPSGYMSEVSDQLDVSLESSKIVELALTWVAMTQSDAIK